MCLVNSNKKKELSHEEIDAEVLVDGVAVSLQPTEETKGGYANGQADQRNYNAHPCDDRQQKFIDAALILKRKKGRSPVSVVPLSP